jgi:UDPglucose 6-dehydrogenase
MNISVIGTGYVGLVTGTCFAELGFSVTCIDTDHTKIEKLHQGIIPIYEPGLDQLVAKNAKAKRLFFTTNTVDGVADANVVFIAVGTPPHAKTGEADLSYVFQAAEDIANVIKGYTVVVTKSTVPVDTAKKLEAHIRAVNPKADFDVVSNPEFLREGSAIEDFLKPNRVVVGCRTKKAEDVMRTLYKPLFQLETPILFTTPESSELIKYAANSFLATKITFINQIADLCEKCDADVNDVALGIGLDSRIGKKFLNAGPGYGGSCFPKDTLALAATARDYGEPLEIVESVIRANDARKHKMVEKIQSAMGRNMADKKVAVLGVTFKPDTDDMRDAPSLTIIPALQAQGAEIHAYDPVGADTAKTYLPNVRWYDDAYAPLTGADALVIMTEWNEFRYLDLKRVHQAMTVPTIIDLRNIYKIEDMQRSNFNYYSLGRAPILKGA